jgi:hypothetical protein
MERLTFINSAVQQGMLIDLPASEVEHNGRANILRKGLGIIAFNILEDYLKKRTKEALNDLSHSGVSFENLTDKMQTASVIKAMNVAQNVLQREKRKNSQTWLADAHREAKIISSPLGGTNYEISSYAFLHEGSNIQADEVNNVLSAFAVDEGWNAITYTSKKLGYGVPSLKQEYENIASRRHAAAHESNFNYEYAHLSGLKNHIIALSAAFDVLLTKRLKIARDHVLDKMQNDKVHEKLAFQYLQYDNGLYKQKKSLSGRSQKNWSDLNQALAILRPKCSANNEVLVVHSLDVHTQQVVLSDWFYS